MVEALRVRGFLRSNAAHSEQLSEEIGLLRMEMYGQNKEFVVEETTPGRSWPAYASDRGEESESSVDRKYQLAFILLVLWVGILQHSEEATAGQFGLFEGRVAVEWVSNDALDRDMRLLEPFGYRDQSGKLWSVPAGAVINGASIPQVLWSVIGSPYTGGYRRASVAHDFYCSEESGFPEEHEDVHRMFYNASRAGGVDEFSARRMYYAIIAFGPKWKKQRIVKAPAPGEPTMSLSVPVVSTWQPQTSEQEVRDFLAWIESTNPSEAEIEARARGFSSVDEPPDMLVLPPEAVFTPMQ